MVEHAPTPCAHENFSASVAVSRLVDTGRFIADVTIKCDQCGQPFQFIGLNPGVSTRDPMVSPDGLEARLPICPEGQEPSFISHIHAAFAPPMGERQ